LRNLAVNWLILAVNLRKAANLATAEEAEALGRPTFAYSVWRYKSGVPGW